MLRQPYTLPRRSCVRWGGRTDNRSDYSIHDKCFAMLISIYATLGSQTDGTTVKVVGWTLVAVGAIFALLAFDLINGNPELAAPGEAVLLGALQSSWRFLFGFFALIAATFLASGVIALRGMPGLSYLALIAFFVLSLPYIVIGGLGSSLSFALILLVLLVIVVPILVFIIALAIGKAVLKRRVSAIPVQ